MMADLLDGLLRANLAGGAAILLVLTLRKPLRRIFGARVAYALWIAVPVAIAASFLPQPATPTMMQPIVLAATGAVERTAPALAADSTGLILLALWIAGVVGATGLLAYRQGRFVASLGRLEPTGEPGVFRAQHTGVGPAVVGALRPRIVSPADFEDRFDADERAVILAHEQVHLRTGDARINALVAAAQCLAWFNPLVHVGARALRIDQELACDAAVLARFPTARRFYGEVLLKTQLAAQPLPFGCHWPASADHPLKERIVMLKSHLPAPARRAAGLALVTTLALGGACLAWAAQAEGPVRISAQHDPAVRAQHEALRSGMIDSDIACTPDGTGRLTGCHLVRPTWVRKPDVADLVKYYPPEALKHGVGAYVTIECTVAPTGYLEGCKVLSETLQGEGDAAALKAAGIPKGAFSDAALELSKIFQARMDRAPGEGIGPLVRIPIRFLVPQMAAKPA